MKQAVVQLFVLSVLFFFASRAKADFTVCNQTTEGQIYVAVAYEYDSGDDSWSRSQGYWTVAQGDCKTTLTDNEPGTRFYLWAWLASDNTKLWSGAEGSGFETGARQFCMEPQGNAFTYQGDDSLTPCASPSESRTFRYAGTADADGDFTYTVEN